MLHPQILELLTAAKEAGLATSMVTNGSRLDASTLLQLQPVLDQLALSVDASSDDLHTALGRGPVSQGGRPSKHLAHVRQLWGCASELGFRLKVNTVVTRLNLDDDMAPLILELQPSRWKVFQVLPVEGQNDGVVDELLISRQEFHGWVERHRAALAAAAAGGHGSLIAPVAEDNEAMRGTYAMLDAHCRFYRNDSGGHVYGPSMFCPDVATAWAAVVPGFSASGFVARGGVYDWGQSAEQLELQRQGAMMMAAARTDEGPVV